MAGPEASEVQVGEVAPDLVLPTTDGGEARLSALRGRPVLLAFFTAAFTSG